MSNPTHGYEAQREDAIYTMADMATMLGLTGQPDLLYDQMRALDFQEGAFHRPAKEEIFSFLDLIDLAESLDVGSVERDEEGDPVLWWLAGKAGGIVVDPLRAHGMPSIPGRTLGARFVVGAYHAEGKNPAIVADDYAITEQDVVCAVALEARIPKDAD